MKGFCSPLAPFLCFHHAAYALHARGKRPYTQAHTPLHTHEGDTNVHAVNAQRPDLGSVSPEDQIRGTQVFLPPDCFFNPRFSFLCKWLL